MNIDTVAAGADLRRITSVCSLIHQRSTQLV